MRIRVTDATGAHREFECARYDCTLYGVLFIDQPTGEGVATRTLIAREKWAMVEPLPNVREPNL